MKPKFRLAAFDLDGTVLERDSSWVAIHRAFGTEHLGAASLRLYTEGVIDYKEFMRRDIASWPRGVKREQIEEILSGYKIRREAPKVMDDLRAMGIKTALVTSGIDILAKDVVRDLKIDYMVANGLRFDRDGILLPTGVGRVDPTRKDLAYRRLLRKVGVRPKQSIAVGDTTYDLAFLKTAGLGFMLAHTTRVPDPDIVHIDRLDEIFSHMR
ncbi:MAG: HAD-IB family phosphatase [Nitrososphaerota archaeon]|nr:HAD-IB family phosphatase [Nitrososphaerota archaeon]MDG7011044.1 HAD-IB family phosphatase [Nitrososphaerota archaeon]